VKAADVRVPHARLWTCAAAVAVCAALLWATRGYTFYFDEWTFILSTDSSWTHYLQPHNEHPAMIPRLIYTALLNTVGLRTYVPYMAVLLALHATNVVLLFELVRRRAGDFVGIAAALFLLVLGAGWENLLWAFQIGFVGSVACGLGALLVVVARPDRMWLATVLLFASLMFSGIGLFFWGAAAVALALTPARRRQLLWLMPIALVFTAWYIAYGHAGGPGTAAPPQTFADRLATLPLYVAWGVGASLAGLIGEGGELGLVLLLPALAVIGLAWRRRRPDAFALGIVAAMIAFYLVLGFNRAQFGYQQSGAGRYVYEGAIFWILLLADAARNLPWRGTWRPAVVACAFLVCFTSGATLYTYIIAKSVQMTRQTADLQALAIERADPCLNPGATVDPLVMPAVTSARAYYHAIDRYGDPVAGRAPIRDADFQRAVANLRKPGCG
jgi:hypothetical protein